MSTGQENDPIVTLPSNLPTGTLNITCKYKLTSYYGQNTPQIGTYNTNKRNNDWQNFNTTSEKTFNFNNKTAKGGESWQIRMQDTSSHAFTMVRSSYITSTFTYTLTFNKVYNYQGKPRSTTVKSIGSKESTTLFGVHSDNTRIDTLN